MTKNADYDAIFGGFVPLSLRLCRRMDRDTGASFLQVLIARIVRRREVFEREWFISSSDSPYAVEAHFVAPRVPLRMIFRLEAGHKPGAVTLKSRQGDQWREEPVKCLWEPSADFTKLTIYLNRLTLTARMRVVIEGVSGETDYQVVTHVLKKNYEDLYLLGRAEELLSTDPKRAEENLIDCMQLAPDHFVAAEELSKCCLKRGDLDAAERWGVAAAAFSNGRYAVDTLREVYERGGTDLKTEVAGLREEAKSWDVGGHHGAVCLLLQKRFWLGFHHVHLVKERRVIDLRRKAAARFLSSLHFLFTPHNELLVFVRLRILGADGEVNEVSSEHLAILDSPEQNAAIRTEERKRAIFHLPELASGDCLELEYVLIHVNRILPDEKPDFFIREDMNSDFPTWRSTMRIDCPRGWPVKCIGIHGAPQPDRTVGDGEWQTFTVSDNRLFFDDWGTYDVERAHSSPHICCSWTDRSWADVGEYARKTSCHTLPDDQLPDALKAVIEPGETAAGKLRLGFEWVRDRLKYMSLPSAKKRLSEPGLAEKILAAGVGDCMDKAFLVHLLCVTLELDAEYVLAAMESEYVVAELPADQFDHILVRVKVDGEWIYLDATNTITPFGGLPFGLQGQRVLRLGSDVRLVDVPEDHHAVNRVTVAEVLTCTEGGDLTGTFEMNAVGIPGRWWDGRWKTSSMSAGDPVRAARVAFTDQLPSARLREYAHHAPDSADTFALSGRHDRRRLESIRERRVGFLDWNTVWFPTDTFKERRWRDLAVFPLPITYEFSAKITCPNGWRIEGSSRTSAFDSLFGAITETQFSNGSTLSITRSLTIKKRFIRAPDVERIPDFLTAVEESLRLAFMLRPE